MHAARRGMHCDSVQHTCSRACTPATCNTPVVLCELLKCLAGRCQHQTQPEVCCGHLPARDETLGDELSTAWTVFGLLAALATCC
jgi:hypothetical protein